MSDCIFCHPERLLILYENPYCFIIAPLDEYSPGHRLVILKNHREDIAADIRNDELFAFIKDIHIQSKVMKKVLFAERIYVCLMCDGVQHLHAHLIPRYKGDKTGFQYLAQQEKKFDSIRYIEKSHEQQNDGYLLSWQVGLYP